jgi:hypothetical protein
MDQFNQYPDSSLLFVKPGFVRGLSRATAPFGRIIAYNYSPTPKEADARAIRSDWRAVGKDVLVALKGPVNEVTAS